MISIEIPELYNWVLFSAILLVTECLIIGFVVAGGTRKKVFNPEFMEQFVAEHEEAFGPGTKPNKEGYPDTGTGYYSWKLPYKDWFEFNSRQRAHANFLEQVFIVVPWVLLVGLTLPIVAITLAGIYFVGRIVYTVGYLQRPANRGKARLFFMSSLLGLLGTSIYSCIKLGLS